jgi:hypothetical protein
VITADNDHGYRDILGSDTPDDHERHPVGADVVYTLELDDDEADQFRAASNCRYLEPTRRPSRTATSAVSPALSRCPTWPPSPTSVPATSISRAGTAAM